MYEEGEEPFSQIVYDYRQSISEVFFAWQDIPSGRSVIATRNGYTDWDAQRRTEEELQKIKSLGIKLDLLFNANCYGEQSLSKSLENKIISVIEYLGAIDCAVDIVTTASLFVAHVVKKHFPQIEVRSSVNMKLGRVNALEQVADLFDSYHIQREYNRDINYLKKIRSWADANGKKIIMLANSGCYANCAGQIFHDNLVAHETQISTQKNADDFNPLVCRRMLRDREKWHTLLQNTWIRPEDINNYEGVVDVVKLATRMHALPGMVVGAYARGYHIGNTLDLLEPGLGELLSPYIINNQAFPEDWFTKTSKCGRMCEECNYCKSVLQKVLLNTVGGKKN